MSLESVGAEDYKFENKNKNLGMWSQTEVSLPDLCNWRLEATLAATSITYLNLYLSYKRSTGG